MRPKKRETRGEEDLFRARLDQIIRMKHELVQLAGKLDWDWLYGEIAPLYSEARHFRRPSTFAAAARETAATLGAIQTIPTRR
jgi:IS5 family transposase